MLTPAVKGLRAQCLGFFSLGLYTLSLTTHRALCKCLAAFTSAEGGMWAWGRAKLYGKAAAVSQPASSPALGSCFSVLKSFTAYCASPAC